MMATVTSIADALATAIDTVAVIDYVSTDSFLPTVQAVTMAAMVVPFAIRIQFVPSDSRVALSYCPSARLALSFSVLVSVIVMVVLLALTK